MNSGLLREYLDDLTKSNGGKSAQLKVFKNGEEIFSYKGGYRDKDCTVKSDFGDTFYLYSLTKPITCAATMQLVEKGVLDLYKPVSTYLPYFKDIRVKSGNTSVPQKNEILLWHLFNMTAGFNYDAGDDRYNAAVNAGLGTSDVFKATTLDVPLSFHAGEHWQYACRSHEALACIIEKVTAQTFYEYLNENIFTPLEMKHIRFTLDGYTKEHITDLFSASPDGNGFVTLEKKYCLGPTDKYESGGYGLISDIYDYSAFANAMANYGIGANGKRILSKDSVEIMRRDFLCDCNRTDFRLHNEGYGYGLGVRTLITRDSRAKSPLGEFGWDGAAGAYTLFCPEESIAAVFLTCTLSGNKKLDQFKIRDLIFA